MSALEIHSKQAHNMLHQIRVSHILGADANHYLQDKSNQNIRKEMNRSGNFFVV